MHCCFSWLQKACKYCHHLTIPATHTQTQTEIPPPPLDFWTEVVRPLRPVDVCCLLSFPHQVLVTTCRSGRCDVASQLLLLSRIFVILYLLLLTGAGVSCRDTEAFLLHSVTHVLPGLSALARYCTLLYAAMEKMKRPPSQMFL